MPIVARVDVTNSSLMKRSMRHVLPTPESPTITSLIMSSVSSIDTRAPLILRDPRRNGGIALDQLVEFVDIFPTLTDLAGLPVPDSLEGTTAVPLIDDPGLLPSAVEELLRFESPVQGSGARSPATSSSVSMPSVTCCLTACSRRT